MVSKSGYSQQILMKFSITKFHENPPSGSRADTRGRADSHVKGFPRINDQAKNWILKKWVGKFWVLPFGSGYVLKTVMNILIHKTRGFT
jgi:hypothetical protein